GGGGVGQERGEGGQVRGDEVGEAVAVEVARWHADGVRVDGVIDRRDERRHAAVFEGLDAWPELHGSQRGPSPATALAPVRCEGGAVFLRPTGECHGRSSLSLGACDRLAWSLPSAQTGRRGGAGPAGRVAGGQRPGGAARPP